jgi:thiamine pyrophosphate-dependent acetolactate synthase large subunit-like protein
MLTFIQGALQLLFLILSRKFEQDKEEKQRKEELRDELKKALSSNDISRINLIINKLRRK